MSMGVYIKMEMPKSCLECRLYNDPWCMAKNRNQWRTAYNRPQKGERQKDCPLVPVPPHGRLIDADALMAEFEKAENAMERHGREFTFSFISSGQEISTEWFAVETMVEDAPTVIPADTAEEGET